MKDLTELQGELQRLSAQLETLARAVEDLKPKEHSRTEDYAAIQKLAQDAPVANDCLKDLSEGKQTAYLRLVCTAAGLDGELTTDQLIYLCRLSIGSGCPVDPKNLSVMAYQTEYLDWQAAATDLREAVLPLLLDMLLTIHQGGRNPERGMDFAAELAALFGCNADDLAVCAQLASALLTADFGAFQAVPAKRPYPQLGYAVPEEWLKKTSFQCGTPYRMRYENKIAWETAEPRSFVTIGTELVRFERNVSGGITTLFQKPTSYHDAPIKAIQDGFVHYTRGKNNKREVWITSAFARPEPEK